MIGMKLCYMGTQNFILYLSNRNHVLIIAGAVRVKSADYTGLLSWGCKHQIKQQITMIRLDLLIILFAISFWPLTIHLPMMVI